MKKRMKAIISLLCVICIGVFGTVMMGCNDEVDPGFNVLVFYDIILETTLYDYSDECQDFVEICNSLDDINEACKRNGYDFFDIYEQNLNPSTASSDRNGNDFSDKYFEKNSIIMCAFVRNNYSGQYRFDSIISDGNKLTMALVSPKNEIAEDIMTSVFVIVGIDKPTLAGATELTYVLL